MLLPSLLRQLSWPELRHHPWRNLAALLAVMLGVALAFSVQLINQSALSEFSSAVRAVNGVPDFELRASGKVGSGFDESLYERVARHPQVAIASPVIELDSYALDAQGGRVPLKIVGIDALVAAPLSPALLPRPSKQADRIAMLEPDAVFLNARARQRLTGDTLRVQTPTGTVTLRVQGSLAAEGAALAVIDIAGVQSSFGWLGRIGRIDVRLRAGADRAGVLRELALPPGIRAAAPDEAAQRVSNVSRAYRVNLTVLALVALFTGAFLVFSILSLSVAKRQPQLALLGVLGLAGRERLALVLAESALLGALGSALGLMLGTALAALALRLLAGDLGGGYFPGVAPALQFDAVAAATYGALGIAAAMIGGWLPARDAQRLAPAQALKGLSASGTAGGPAWLGPALLVASIGLALLPPIAGIPLAAYASVACLLLGGIACVPAGVAGLLKGIAPPHHALALLAVERARHQRHTATIAVAGVVASLSLAVALTVMVASFRDSVTQWLDTVLPADLYLRAASSARRRRRGHAATPRCRAAQPSIKRRRCGPRPSASLPLQLDALRSPRSLLLARALPDPEKNLPLVGELLPLPPGGDDRRLRERGNGRTCMARAPGATLVLPLSNGTGTHGHTRVRARRVARLCTPAVARWRWRADDYQTPHRRHARINDMALWLQPGRRPRGTRAARRCAHSPPTSGSTGRCWSSRRPARSARCRCASSTAASR